MSFKVIGTIRESQSNKGLPELVVKAFDKYVVFDDYLGSTITDENGDFEILYEEKAFKQIFDAKPNIYLTVNTKDGRTILTTKKNVKMVSGKVERFDFKIPKSIVEGNKRIPIGLRFSRRMSGFFLENTEDYKLGAEIGGRRKNVIAIRCRITIDDLNKFLEDPEHLAQLEGQIDYGDLGSGLHIQNGIFNLLKLDPIESKQKIIYRFSFNSKSGQPYLFVGEKVIYQDQNSYEMLKDIITLYTRVYHGFSQSGKISGAGILGFRADNFFDVFDSLEVLNASNSFERIGAISMFHGFIYKELENIYRKN